MRARTELTVEERNEETVRRFVREIVNGGTYDLVEELFAGDDVRHDPTIREEKRGRGVQGDARDSGSRSRTSR